MSNREMQGADQLPVPFDVLSQALMTSRAKVQAKTTSLSTDLAAPAQAVDPEQDVGHLWAPQEVLAIAQAWASGRPLLIRGEPGCGKSQLAKVLAQALKVELFTEVIHPRFEALELLYKVDHVRRLATAQLLGAIGAPALARAVAPVGPQEKVEPVLTVSMQSFIEEHLPERLFVQPGVLLKAFREAPPRSPEAASPLWPRAVVLIDEIDKADADLPNTLLGVLGERCFSVPGESQPAACDAHRPLILITTNEDRELPPAFVRRCAVLNLKPPEDRGEFVAWLVARARAHPELVRLDVVRPAVEPTESDETLLRVAAQQVWQDRVQAKDQGFASVGLAEYLDLLYGLFNIGGGDAARAWPWLDRLSAYALVKHKDLDQQRRPHQTSATGATG